MSRLDTYHALVDFGAPGSVAEYVDGLVAQRDELLGVLLRIAARAGTRHTLTLSTVDLSEIRAVIKTIGTALANAEGR